MAEFISKIMGNGISYDILHQGLLLDKKGISTWLEGKSLLKKNDDLLSFEELTSWTRTGEETYSTTFSFITERSTYHLIAKAIVSMFPEKRLLDWGKRRKILLDNHIPVSNWLWTGEATIIETYYPKTYTDVKNFEDLLRIAFSLDKLGFITLKFLDDLRCDQDGNPFYIDFGFDLGEPTGIQQYCAQQYLIGKYSNLIETIQAFYISNLKN